MFPVIIPVGSSIYPTVACTKTLLQPAVSFLSLWCHWQARCGSPIRCGCHPPGIYNQPAGASNLQYSLFAPLCKRHNHTLYYPYTAWLHLVCDLHPGLYPFGLMHFDLPVLIAQYTGLTPLSMADIKCCYSGCNEFLSSSHESLKNHLKSSHGIDPQSSVQVCCAWPACGKKIEQKKLSGHVYDIHIMRARPM